MDGAPARTSDDVRPGAMQSPVTRSWIVLESGTGAGCRLKSANPPTYWNAASRVSAPSFELRTMTSQIDPVSPVNVKSTTASCSDHVVVVPVIATSGRTNVATGAMNPFPVSCNVT